MKEKIKIVSIAIIGLSTLVTAITVLISVTNSFLDYIKTRNWDKNVNIIRFSTEDFIVIYNGNPKPIFVNRFEYSNYALAIAGSKEINQTIPPYSYLNFNNDDEKIKWDQMFKGDDIALQKIIKVGLNKLDSPYKFIFFNESHPILNLFNRTYNYPRTFDFSTELILNFENQEKMFPIKSKGIIVIKRDLTTNQKK
jgi:hypothetical protein